MIWLSAIVGVLYLGLAIVDLILRDALDAIFESLIALLFVALLFGGLA